jgi:hypothetical protein
MIVPPALAQIDGGSSSICGGSAGHSSSTTTMTNAQMQLARGDDSLTKQKHYRSNEAPDIT